MAKENDLEGNQDMGGKHGGQAGLPKEQAVPDASEREREAVKQEGKQRGLRGIAPDKD